jgi:hypothetical protein
MTTRSKPTVGRPIRKMIRLADLTSAPWNPPGRTEAKALRSLIDSMHLIGQLHPITVGKDFQIIDGHRRAAAAQSLGWKEIEANIVEEEPTAIYASVNVTARRMSGNDALLVWLKKSTAAPARLIPRFNEMEQALGRNRVERLTAAGFSLRLYLTARRIAKYCEEMDKVGDVVDWLLEFPVVGQVMKAMESGVSPKKIMSAVKAKKAVKLTLAVA